MRRASSSRTTFSALTVLLVLVLVASSWVGTTSTAAERAGGRLLVLREATDDGEVGGGLYTVRPDGSHFTYIAPDRVFREADVNPSGTRIAYTLNDFALWPAMGARQIYTMAPDGTDIVRLTSFASNVYQPAWSPDGSRIAFFDNPEQIWTIEPDGTDLRLVAQADCLEDLDWSADGETLWVTSCGDPDLYSVPSSGGELTRYPTPERERDVSVAPDGTIAVTGYSSELQSGVVWLRDPDGSDRRVLTSDAELINAVSFSPDGTELAVIARAEGDLPVRGARAAIIDVATGALTFVPTTLRVGSEEPWVQAQRESAVTWLPAPLPPDDKGPTIMLSPPPGSSFAIGADIVATFTCDDPSGVASCSAEWVQDGEARGALASGTRLDSSRATEYGVQVHAVDARGNTSTAVTQFAVRPGGSLLTGVVGGETVSTGATATPTVPVQTSVTVPIGVSGILQVQPQDLGDPPSGFAFFGRSLVIEGPAATQGQPYLVSFRVDESVLGGVAPADVVVWRNGSVVPGCTEPEGAVPDPCVVSRGFTPEPGDGGDALVTVRTSRFSTWTLGAVAYAAAGPFAPVDPLPTVNTTKAGSAVPVKFRLGGDRGLDVFAPGYPKVLAGTCSGATDEVEQTLNTGTSELTYDAGSQQYVYKWKTSKTDSGCKDLVLRLKDGSEVRARLLLR